MPDFFHKARNLSHGELKILAKFSGGIAALVLVVMIFSGSFSFLPGQLKLALSMLNKSANTADVSSWNSNGTYSWTAPPGVTQAYVTVVGGGGGTSGSAYTGDYGSSAGGGSGGYISNQLVSVTPGQTYSVVVGKGGAGGVVSGNGCWPGTCPGGSGGSSSVTGPGVAISATGGGAGTTGPAGSYGGEGAGGTPNGVHGDGATWYDCSARNGGVNGSGYGSGGNGSAGCPHSGYPGQDGYVSIAPMSVSLTANPSSVSSGSYSNLDWSANTATASICKITDQNNNIIYQEPGSQIQASGTASSGALTSSTTFTLSCTDSNNITVSTSTTVTIVPASLTLTPNPAATSIGGISQLTWTSQSVDQNSCSVTQVDPSGAVSTISAVGAGDNASMSTPALTQTGTYTYTLSCTTPVLGGNTGMVVGSPTVVAGKFGQALTFSTADQGIILKNSISLASGTWSISGWFEMPLPNNAQRYATLTRGTNDSQVLVQETTNLLGTYDNTNGTGFHSSGFNVSSLSNGWHHVVAVGQGGATTFYVDGTNVGSANFESTNNVYYLGNPGGGQPIGTADDIRVYNRALSSADITALYNGGQITNGLVGYWPLDYAVSEYSQQKTVILTSGTSWTVPNDWNNAANTIEVIGGGGGGGGGTSNIGGGGGGGGGYNALINATLTPGATVGYSVGGGGSAGAANANGTAGGNTYFCNSNSNCSSVTASAVIAGVYGGAAGLHGSGNANGGAGGGGYTGSLGYVGGTGGYGVAGQSAGAGGGGAGGPSGPGGGGGSIFAGGAGGYGGGGGNGGAFGAQYMPGGSPGGGNGGNGPNGTGGGVGVSGGPGGNGAGNSGGGAGGGASPSGAFAGGNGAGGTVWTQTSNGATAGPGGGGGGGSAQGYTTTAAPAGNGGLYGGGGGGGGQYSSALSAGGAGAPGIIVISYTPAPVTQAIFRISGNFTVPTGVLAVNVLVVGGGGGGGCNGGGGGGGGGVIYMPNYAVTPGDVLGVTVGAGGGVSCSNPSTGNGSPSVFNTNNLHGSAVNAIGGGGGASRGGAGSGAAGGSGGGGGGDPTYYVAGTGTAGQGNNGGSGYNNSCGSSGGGGGGAGGPGGNGNNYAGGGGGNGIVINGGAYGGGGGGGNTCSSGASHGGGGSGGVVGGGGFGGGTIYATAPGAANTGGGGGGGGGNGTSPGNGTGGSGVVIVSYSLSQTNDLSSDFITKSATVTVSGSPSVSLTASSPVSSGGASTLNWSSSNVNAGSCAIVQIDPNSTVSSVFAMGSNDSGTNKPGPVLSLPGTYTYKLACFGPYGSGNNGTLTGTPTTGSAGEFGQAIGFSGTANQYVSVPDAAALDPTNITLSAWVYPTTATHVAGASVMCKGNGAGGEVYCLDFPTANNLTPRFYFWKSGVSYTLSAATALTANAWSHIVVTYDGVSSKMYVNGVLSNSSTPNAGPLSSNTHILSIAARQSASSNYDLPFVGAIDDVRVYSRALSSDEISTLYNGGQVTTGLAAYWPFDSATISGTTANDETGGVITQSKTVSASGSTPPSSLTLSASRVQSGSPSTLTWSVPGGIPAGNSCFLSLASNLANNATGAVLAASGSTTTVPITHVTAFTLTCGNGMASTTFTANATLVPNVKEI